MTAIEPRPQHSLHGKPHHGKPHHVPHAGPCGERMPCPEHGWPFGSYYRPAERLRNGDIVAHDCGKRWRWFELAA